MDVVRRISLLVTAGLLGIAVMLGGLMSRPTVSANVAKELNVAAAFFDSTIVLAREALPRGPRGDQLAISLGYLERQRLGFGDPFRLADEALADPRLNATMQNRVAWALLARLRRGEAYVLDPRALDDIGPWSSDTSVASGRAHLALIERTVAGTSDPRAGELAVRLAYAIAATKGSISPVGVGVATDAAAIVRDRLSSRADLQDLLADASAQHADALELLKARRAERAFRVERPGLAPVPADLQVEAMRAVPALVRAIDTLDRVVAPAETSVPLLGPYFASRLAAVGKLRPPVAQVVVTLGGYAQSLGGANNEETLIAASVEAANSDSSRQMSARAMLSSAVALRTLGQSVPWFPGMGGPSLSEIVDEFGIGAVAFARSVPNAWRPYYLRELQLGLRDMRRVFPAQSFSGLGVRFGTDVLRDSALALHDPRTRTLQLSIGTSGGTLAHELSHDIDWQASRRMFASGGGYSTDRVVREKTGALASSLRGLAEARLFRVFSGGASAPPVDRPAELFARGTDWFVASALAQQGRMNGFLSAIGDGSIAGYAAGAPTAIGSAAAASLVAAISAIAYVPDSIRVAFETEWSDPRRVDPVLLVRRVLDTPVSWRPSHLWSTSAIASGDTLLPSNAAQLCVADDSPELRARRNLLMLTIDARARGMVLRRARYRPLDGRSVWANSVLGAIPWSPSPGERVVDNWRAAIVASLATALPSQGVLPVIPAIFRSSAANCSTIAR